jgi:hypothetical protein
MPDTPETLYRLSTRLIEALDQQSKLNDEIKAINARLLELAPEKAWIVALSPTLFRVIDTRLDDVQVGDSLDVLFPETVSTGPVTPPADKPAKRTRKAETEQPPAPAAPQRDLAIEEILGRLKSAIEAGKTSASEYAKKHDLPYLALVKMLSGGEVGADMLAVLRAHAAAIPAPTATAVVEAKPSAGTTPPPAAVTDAELRDLCRKAAAKVGPVRVRELMGAHKVEQVPADARPGVVAKLTAAAEG